MDRGSVKISARGRAATESAGSKGFSLPRDHGRGILMPFKASVIPAVASGAYTAIG